MSLKLRRTCYPIRITLPSSVVQQADQYAKNAMIGGRSNVRASDDRMARLYEDQMTGQLCHAAASVYLFGSFDPWKQQRQQADANPTKGDGGTDFLGWPIDVKGSKMRRSDDPNDYHLIVRPAELHDDVWYIRALVARDCSDMVYLAGVASGSTIRKTIPAVSGPFAGAYAIATAQLAAIELVWVASRNADTMHAQSLGIEGVGEPLP